MPLDVLAHPRIIRFRCATAMSVRRAGFRLKEESTELHAFRHPHTGRHSLMHTVRNILMMILLAVCVSGCSHEGGGTNASNPNETPASSPSVAAAASARPTDDPCALLTDAEVRGMFPNAESGKRNTESLQYGLDRCAWETPTGQIGVEVSKVEAAAFEEEVRGQLQGAIDPRVEGAIDRIRFQNAPDIGADHAIAVLEKADAQRGIYTDIALLAIQRGHRMAVLMIHNANGDAPLPPLDTLKGLGRPLAARL